MILFEALVKLSKGEVKPCPTLISGYAIFIFVFKLANFSHIMGAQWLSGRVLDSRPRGCGLSLTSVTVLCH